jgi:hypothetical protein
MDIVTLTVICGSALLVLWMLIAYAVYRVRKQSAVTSVVVEATPVVAETVVNEPVVESVPEVAVVEETPVKKVRKPRKPKTVVEPVKEPVKAKRGAKKRSPSKKV